jgi:adenosylmethionine-8-amino-7-oxononanoate aminotransferase
MGTNMSENKLADRLVEWAQNNEMIDKWYTDHGKDCLEAAKLIESFENFTKLNRIIE